MTIDLQPWASDIEELAPGETIRVNHGTYCESGEDTRRRLYLTRTLADPTVTVGFCHNCQESGILTEGSHRKFRNERHTKEPDDLINTSFVKELVVPTNLIQDRTLWPSYAVAWAYKNKLNQEMIDAYGIGFDVSTDRIYLPQYNLVALDGEGAISLEGYQLRAVNGKGPKYLTVHTQDSRGYTVLRSKGESPADTLVIVEDLVSGMHIMAAVGVRVDVLVNYGVAINPLAINMTMAYKNAIVWLDNDSQHIRNRAKNIQRTIALYSEGTMVHVVEDFIDPKHCSSYDISTEIGRLV